MALFSTFLLSNIDLSLLFHYRFPTLRVIRAADSGGNPPNNLVASTNNLKILLKEIYISLKIGYYYSSICGRKKGVSKKGLCLKFGLVSFLQSSKKAKIWKKCKLPFYNVQQHGLTHWLG